MPDFTMCQDDKCPAASKCKRSPKSGTAPDPFAQSYTNFQRKSDRCQYFFPLDVKSVEDEITTCKKRIEELTEPLKMLLRWWEKIENIYFFKKILTLTDKVIRGKK